MTKIKPIKEEEETIIGKTISKVEETSDMTITLYFTDGTKQSISCAGGDYGPSIFFSDD